MTILLTGAAGFIGAHVSAQLLDMGYDVIGLDNLNDYYATTLKQDRLSELQKYSGFKFRNIDFSDKSALRSALSDVDLTAILHLGAQAGVRYSIDNPETYVSSNLVGHCNLLELARDTEISHMIYASSSSVYGGNTRVPFSENDVTADPVSFYGATKQSNELMSHSYARLYQIPLTGLRFFTVYGPKGRPDMAYWIFADKILKGQPIRVFNNGNMKRDFTYIDDVVNGVIAALQRDLNVSPNAPPHRIYNIGNDKPEQLMDLIGLLETQLGIKANKTFEPMQSGDVESTWADISRARTELNYSPTVNLKEGIGRFVDWFKSHAAKYT